MILKFFKNSFLAIILFCLLFSFSSYTEDLNYRNNFFNDFVDYDNPDLLGLSGSNKLEYVNYILLDKSFVGFKEALAFKESCGNYSVINKLGYLGKYQFGLSTLSLLGINDTDYFLSSPKLQEKVFLANLKRNKWVLRRDILRFSGKKINGILITESGILAAAHLAGPGSIKKYLRSHGAFNFQDAFGTTVESYLNNFSKYDLSNIIALRRPVISFTELPQL